MSRRGWLFWLCLLPLLAGCSSPAQRLYRRAETYFAQGKWELAAADYSALVGLAPNDPLAPNALYKLAYLYRQEFQDPAAALALYQRLAWDYSDSPFARDALLWMVYIQARQLQDPEAVLRTCQLIDETFPDDTQLRARARLQLARAYQQAGRVASAQAVLQEVLATVGEDAESAAEATYQLALLTRDSLQQPDQATKLLESVVTRYPGTLAASKARQALGWQYYATAGAQEKARQAALARLARTLSAPPFPSGAHPALQLLGALRSLLAQAGTEVSLEDLLTTTGLSFQMVFAEQNPTQTLYFSHSPLPLAAEAWGFGYNAWTFRSAPEALLPLASSLAADRPALLLWGASPQWCLFTGFRPPQPAPLVLLRPGQSSPSNLTEAQFAQGWPTQAATRLFPALPPTGYQFALTERATSPSRAQVIREAVQRAELALEQSDLLGAPAGRAAYQALAQRLAEAAGQPPGEAPQRLATWAEGALPLLVRARQAAASSLAAVSGELPGQPGLAAGQAARRYTQFAERWQGLGESLRAVVVTPTPEAWRQLRVDYSALAAEEQQTLQSLAAALGG